MNNTLRNSIFFLVFLSIFSFSCQSNKDKPELTKKPTEDKKESVLSPEEEEIKAIVEKFLVVAGNSDLEAMDSMISDKANLGIAVVRDGVWKNSVSTIGEYFERAKLSEHQPYFEPVNEYKILINKGQIAFVWADATLYTYGVPRTNNIDNFTLIKEDGEWKFINLSFTNTRLPEALKKFDLEVFAKSYAQAWCSQRPNFVALFFAKDGLLVVNDGEPAIGTNAITKVAKGFMDTFPDMVVSMDSLITKMDQTRFYWTLTGTNDVPNGTGNKVNISGFEEWTLSDDGLIQESKGHFDDKEYLRQLESGIDN